MCGFMGCRMDVEEHVKKKHGMENYKRFEERTER